MSHIFDALQRAEVERTGIDIRVLSAATELLQIAERQAAVGGETAPEAETAVQPEIVADRQPPVPLQVTRSTPTTAEFPIAAEPSINTDVDQLSHFQSLRVLAPPQSRLVCLTDKESLAAEKFRFLGVRLRQLQQSRQLKKVLITSTIPQEGKTTVAANLACTLVRRARQKTLLVEGDLRRPSLAQLFGLGKTSGICEWLQGERGPMTSIYYLEGPGLWILPAGSTSRNPLELMQAERLSVLMDQLTAWFDWIVIDSPPVLPLADASIWMRLVDGILLVTRQGTTERKQLERGLEVLDKTKLVGTLINSSSNTAHRDYYHYSALPVEPGAPDVARRGA
jgi:capsular exopolysaccharide synthesis family protein